MNEIFYLLLPILAAAYMLVYLPLFWRPPPRRNGDGRKKFSGGDMIRRRQSDFVPHGR